jgi:hypothetical protein
VTSVVGLSELRSGVAFGRNVLICNYSYYGVVRDRPCGLVVRVLDYRSRGPGFDSRALQKKK